MVSQDSLLVTLVNLVDRLPMPALPAKRGRGHPQVYPDRLFLKALVIMIVRCKLQNSVSYFWDSSMSYCLNCSAWRSVLDDREQVKKYDTEFSDVHPFWKCAGGLCPPAHFFSFCAASGGAK